MENRIQDTNEGKQKSKRAKQKNLYLGQEHDN